MPRSGPRPLHRSSDAFTLTAVRLSQQPGLQVQTVAAALEIHPFMLSRWRKDALTADPEPPYRRPVASTGRVRGPINRWLSAIVRSIAHTWMPS